ncbi:uncharacterized protein C8Q71DRAFT_748705 [Rhodofomes roseus]|uniref:Secreted protein n=1 Tax=Rhodofomes roseus TaxID=34475 RepID=A0ABQ8KMC2_9APHY|nr:uncharacterized protein C8Q71DRAFT_748705 [Rhodofomes roseus]KAH9839243.1 hypothetical protein C8Q71DRAFT_748705 [Rhodofomes roseus]
MRNLWSWWLPTQATTWPAVQPFVSCMARRPARSILWGKCSLLYPDFYFSLSLTKLKPRTSRWGRLHGSSAFAAMCHYE